jgi:hypothetical protein
MGNLNAVARQRAVMTTIADLIVAAAVGKGLRVAVGCVDPDKMTFADHLTRALHARGRPCRCLSPSQRPSEANLRQTVALITSGGPDPDENELCRIDIHLSMYQPVVAAPGLAPARSAGDDGDADIVVDYADPRGPAIRHIGSILSPPVADKR